MISGNGYREFAAAFNRGVVKPGSVIVVEDKPHAIAHRKGQYVVINVDTLREPKSGYPSEGWNYKSRKVLQGAPWYITEKASEQQI